MGYTHYWKKRGTSTPLAFEEFIFEAEKIFAVSDVAIATSIRGEERLDFNGMPPDDYEDFVLKNASGDNFCKTQFRPYDEVVCAVLILAKKHFGSAITISSDGSWEEWAPGRDLYQTTFPNREARSPFNK